jgi:uncharacterized protein with PIN domain|tara:strand:- start:222 stop:506 length:285 start_codon:yes stop_codon:yes gene_type:complete
MSKFERKLRRQQAKEKKKAAEKEMAQKTALFGKLPDHCLACEAPFDKKNKEMVMSWSVTVREAEKKVNLYCPRCWDLAMKLTQQVLEEKDNGDN